VQQVRSALDEVDVVLHRGRFRGHWAERGALFGLLEPVRVPVLGVLTKIDLVRPKGRLLPMMDVYQQRRPGASVVPVSAIAGDGLDELIEELFGALPEGPPLYPPDITTTQTERFFVAEVVREKLLERTRDELPYTSGVLVENFEDRGGLVHVDAVIYVERRPKRASSSARAAP
jgi:GTP-binding protein Era